MIAEEKGHIRVNGGYISYDIDHIATQLVSLNIHKGRVCREVDFCRYIKQEGLVQQGTLQITKVI